MKISSLSFKEQANNIISKSRFQFNNKTERIQEYTKNKKGVQSITKNQKNLSAYLFVFFSLILISTLVLISWKVSNEHFSHQIYEVNNLKFVYELPICTVIFPSQNYSQQILTNSVYSQNYTNIKIIVSKNKNVSYYELKTDIKTKCIKDSLIIFVNSPLRFHAFSQVNKKMQHFKAWIVVSRKNSKHQILAFFYRIYDLIQINDFQKRNTNLLLLNDRNYQAEAMSILSQLFVVEIDRNLVMVTQEQSYFSFNFNNDSKAKTTYSKILRLTQDYKAKTIFFQKKQYKTKYFQNHKEKKIGKVQMLRALDRQQLIYLPQNHTICKLENQEYEKKYQISKYQEKVRFCITVLSHNNIENRRYAKVIDSILQQKYENYHIVFIDDFSDDATMKESIKYFQEKKFPKNRLQFVQNLDRNFATYNIMNAAFNFCADDDVQVLMDGDDQFIGKLVFQTFNVFYQKEPHLWVVHSNFKSSEFQFGVSEPTLRKTARVREGKRAQGSFFGPVRTWRVRLVRAIPIKYHTSQNGNWLDTMYDQAFAHSLIELAGLKRFKYVPEVFYEYNTNYGDNDNANDEKVRHRRAIYFNMLNLPVLDELKKLDDTVKAVQVERALTKDKGLKFEVLTEQS